MNIIFLPINVFEDLTKIDSDKYEYNLPSYEFNSQKDLENKFLQL